MYSTSNNAVTKTVEVGGTPFAYREVGPAVGIPVVFLHHFTAVLDDWDPAVVQGHRDILAAFRERDPDLVEQVFRRHATAGVELLLDEVD